MWRASKNTLHAGTQENLAVITDRSMGEPVSWTTSVWGGACRVGDLVTCTAQESSHMWEGSRLHAGNTAGGVSALPLEEEVANHICFSGKVTLFLRPSVG